MADKRMTLDEIVDQLQDGMTIGLGGWATRRKPMALARAIARSKLKDLTVMTYGGPDVGLLAATGKIKKLIFAFVSMDQIPLDPHFRAARQAGGFDILELD
ncbi:CoA-transferase, partial [Brevundimonas sp.]|uniref:CoA-transferase n=1 Tax=Brevundimonas sp. TaxID=1871086 RepID=UPI002FC8AD59